MPQFGATYSIDSLSHLLVLRLLATHETAEAVGTPTGVAAAGQFHLEVLQTPVELMVLRAALEAPQDWRLVAFRDNAGETLHIWHGTPPDHGSTAMLRVRIDCGGLCFEVGAPTGRLGPHASTLPKPGLSTRDRFGRTKWRR
jgi:hypothetical protein